MFSTSGRTEARTVAGELPAKPKSRSLTMKPFGMTRTLGYAALTTARNSMGPSAWLKTTSRIAPEFSAQPERKTEIEKRSWFGGSLL